jgi:K+-transporting ATPase ATPase C chain
VANADLQAARVADARKLSLATVNDLIAKNTTKAQLGILGETTVNVVTLNDALNHQGGSAQG